MFVKGEKYKRKHIHIKYGGGHQSGISNSSNKPFIFIFSGKSGKDHGYSDEWDEEGYFWYSGQGQKGDMAFVRGNKSILNHQIDDNKIFLFEGTNVSGYWAFVDELQLVDYKWVVTPDTEGENRNSIIFKFLSVSKKSTIHNKLYSKSYDHNRPNTTERKGLVVSRVGQGWYRNQLLDKWESTCPITGCSTPKILIASHIVPWSESNDEDRLNVHNGILLSPDVDALFDKHLISFSDEGEMLLSTEINSETLDSLGVPKQAVLPVDEDMKPFLALHRSKLK